MGGGAARYKPASPFRYLYARGVRFVDQTRPDLEILPVLHDPFDIAECQHWIATTRPSPAVCNLGGRHPTNLLCSNKCWIWSGYG